MRVLALLFLTVFVTSSGIHAQPVTAPSIPAAEQAFDRGLRSFSAGQYGAAHESFVRAARDFEFHQRTTAAELMAGRALMALGDFEEAASAMTGFIARYPRSRYVPEAREVRRRASERMGERPATREVTTLGIMLPLAGNDAVFAQALFNGVRMAVDAHNHAHPDEPIRMVFRDSGGTAPAASSAVTELARAGAAAIIGPLYSEEAMAAAEVAQRAGVVLVTPLATDARVSENRRLVFQANPTFPVRGRAMARYALEVGFGQVGAVAVSGTFAEDMVVAFRRELEDRGRSLVFDERLPRGEAWFQLPDRLSPELLAEVDAVYFPVTGAGAHEHAAGALRGLDQVAVAAGTSPRVLGNAEWQNLQSAFPLADRYRTHFTTDYFVGDETAALRGFMDRYVELAGSPPDRLAFKGYDVAKMLLPLVAGGQSGGRLADALRRAPRHRGLAHRIEFSGEQVNQHLFIVRYRGASMDLVR